MSRLQEALLLKTDEQRLAWFKALTPEERQDVMLDVTRIADAIKAALRPLVDACVSVAVSAEFQKAIRQMRAAAGARLD